MGVREYFRVDNPSDGAKAAKLPTDVAIRGGVIDSKSNLVRNYRTGGLVTFEQAVNEDSLIDVKLGTLRVSANKTLDFQQALDAGLLVEVHRPLALSDALTKEVFDKKTGLFLDPAVGRWLTLSEAIDSGLIESDSAHVQDTLTGFLRKIPLTAAIEAGLIDGKTAAVTDLAAQQQHSLASAFARRLVVDSKAPVSIQRMIRQGRYDETTGRLVDPTSGRQITVHEALRRLIVDPNLPCYFDRQVRRPLSLAETCRVGIIDRQTSQFRLPQTKLGMPLNEALEREFILDLERPFSLYDALNVGFFDGGRNCFVHPTNNRQLDLDAACKEKLIDAAKSIVKNAKTGCYMRLDEAVTLELIDTERNFYLLPSTRGDTIEELTLLEAMERKLIVTSKSGLSLEEAIDNGLYAPETGRFVDPSVGDLLDLNQALEHFLVDETTSSVVDVFSGQLSTKSRIQPAINWETQFLTHKSTGHY